MKSCIDSCIWRCWNDWLYTVSCWVCFEYALLTVKNCREKDYIQPWLYYYIYKINKANTGLSGKQGLVSFVILEWRLFIIFLLAQCCLLHPWSSNLSVTLVTIFFPNASHVSSFRRLLFPRIEFKDDITFQLK